MLGFVIGTICLFALVRVLRRGYYGYGHRGFYAHRAFHNFQGWHGWHGHPAWHGHGFHGRGWGRGVGRRGALNWLFYRLDASHGQEKVIINEWETLRETFQSLRSEARDSRAAAAALLRAEHLDADALQTLWRQHDALLAKVRERLGQAVSRVHEALDDGQRRQLAEWLEQGI